MEAGIIDTLERMQGAGHEQVTYFYDEATGLRAIVAIHSTHLGPALGGCRMWPYESEAAALEDVLRLSRGMTYKNAAMGLPLGGGKAVMIGDSRTDKTPELFRAFGRAVERLGGRYVTAEDVGTEPEDMVAVRSQTEHVVGLPTTSGDPSPATAFGVFSGIRAALEHAFGDSDLRGRRVAVQGLGAVGIHLCKYLHEEGAELVVTDIAQERMDEAAAAVGAKTVAPGEIYDVECDVFAPCALGAVVNDGTLPRFKARIIAGSANNQLAEARHGEALQARGILYAPDFIINGGGVINVADELKPGGYDRTRAYALIARIGEKVARALRLADELGISSAAAAEMMADERLKGSAAN
ncbi:MAG: Glu/Leu/Phe/Val dehydrogenase dimerization domain-containing protein [Trueperaceae bacterium]|nr:Glu/Leu/Phe/Val dehydrogenase dimerization domain-containing protein [Trueperaceae bacterium]HRQ09925.1 Glu/Leu/Phe/Val dehydrogenase dimerization domain-containing protein [Trueperaceae bacterium]